MWKNCRSFWLTPQCSKGRFPFNDVSRGKHLCSRVSIAWAIASSSEASWQRLLAQPSASLGPYLPFALTDPRRYSVCSLYSGHVSLQVPIRGYSYIKFGHRGSWETLVSNRASSVHLAQGLCHTRKRNGLGCVRWKNKTKQFSQLNTRWSAVSWIVFFCLLGGWWEEIYSIH